MYQKSTSLYYSIKNKPGGKGWGLGRFLPLFDRLTYIKSLDRNSLNNVAGLNSGIAVFL